MDYVTKRNGDIVPFDSGKIVNAITLAMRETENGVDNILAQDIAKEISSLKDNLSVEQIQDLVEEKLMACKRKDVARAYIRYRYKKELLRQTNKTYDSILDLVELQNDELKDENSNKNAIVASTQRDYIAGEVSKDLTLRMLLPSAVVEAHKEGILHFHDADYFIQHLHNCDLVNLEDMLQNGTVINGTLIEKPHSFSTACNIATQIMAVVASGQYGGQSISLAHLAPFVDISRQKIRKDVEEEFAEFMSADESVFTTEDEKKIADITEKRLHKEIERGVQTMQYQINTLNTSNGQTPFVTVFMYLGEAKNEREKQDLAMIIEEVLNQRIEGVKNEKGVWITPAFPKLIYVLEEENVHENSRFYELTKLAAKCTAKRMVPDYISEKIMKQVKDGNCFPVMGCVDGKEVVAYQFDNKVHVESIERMWNRLKNYYPVEFQPNQKDFVMQTPGVKIYDQLKGYVDNYGIVCNHNKEWLRITFSNGRVLSCTPDHPFETIDNRIVSAKDLKETDLIYSDVNSDYSINSALNMRQNRAWLFGFSICDSTYFDCYRASIASHGEDEIKEFFCRTIKDEYNLEPKVEIKNRGQKGNYIDLTIVPDGRNSLSKLRLDMIKMFEGKSKNMRHIPNDVFSWSLESKLAFLAGMIDADGYLNTSSKIPIIQIGSTNKELAIQQSLLAQNCGMPSKIYKNHYNANHKDNIRYRVEFVPTKELLSFIKCAKKTDLKNTSFENVSSVDTNIIHITTVESYIQDGFSYDVTTASEHFTVSGIYSHNCRSALTVWHDENGKPKFYGRFNQGVVTINLVDASCSAKNEEDFWKILDERLELCHIALQARHKRLEGTVSDISPIHWQYGALARLKKGETIDKLLFGGYSTLSLGYAGLWECVYKLSGYKLTDEVGKNLGLRIMQKLNDKCAEWKEAENIDYSVYGSPIETTCYKFARCLQKRFGIIEGVTDKNYISNSYHVHVTEPIDAFSKLKLESEFQKLSPGGAISYVEIPNMSDNIPAVLEIIKFIYDNIMYAELNTKSDYCQVCGWDGEIKIVEDGDKLVWECPNCGNRDQSKMNVARRTCGRP